MELALVAPIIIIVLIGIVECGLIMYAKGVITNARREGARPGVELSSPRRPRAENDTKVREYLGKSGFTDPVAISVTPDPPPASSGAPLAVHVTYF